MKTDIRRYLAADSAARRLKLNTEAGTTQSSVQNSRTLQKDLADEIRALLKQRYHPADRIIDFIKQYECKHSFAVCRDVILLFLWGCTLTRTQNNEIVLKTMQNIQQKLDPGTGLLDSVTCGNIPRKRERDF